MEYGKPNPDGTLTDVKEIITPAMCIVSLDNGKRHMHLHLYEDIDSQKLWMSKQLHNGDWPYRLLLRLEYTEETDLGHSFLVSVYAVSPTACQKKWKSAAGCYGMTLEQFQILTEEAKCQVLMEYGMAACLYQVCGHNQRKLLKEARYQMTVMEGLFGFYMDKPQNRLGASGWDFIAGNPLGGLVVEDEPGVIDEEDRK